jgi:parvulin-like peptidyl-prolyl isomerase
MTTSCGKADQNTSGGRIMLALLGLALALFGSTPLQRPAETEDVLVWVNHQPVTSAQLSFAVKRLIESAPDGLNEAQRESILEFLVDEELLLQRAEMLDLYHADPSVRKTVAQAVIDRVVTNFLSKPVDLQQLLLFFRYHQSVFERPPRAAVEVLRLANLQLAERARAAILAGANIKDIDYADDVGTLSHLPQSPLPAHVLRRYLGTSLADVAFTLKQGQTSEPVLRADGVYLVRTRFVEPAEVPEFNEVRVQVEGEYGRRGRDWALDQTLAELWQSADIEVNKDVTAGLVPTGEQAYDPSQTFPNHSN